MIATQTREDDPHCVRAPANHCESVTPVCSHPGSQLGQPSSPLATMPENGETAPLLGENVPNLARNTNLNGDATADRVRRAATVRAVTYGVLTTLFVVALVLMLSLWDKLSGTIGRLPKDPHQAALVVLQKSPIIVSLVSWVHT